MTRWAHKKASKFGNKRVKMDGYSFDSIAESRHYMLLKDRLARREITDLQIHPRYPLAVNGRKITTYEADFAYRIAGHMTVEDVKGFPTPEYVIKRELFIATYPYVNFQQIDVSKGSKRKAWEKMIQERAA